MRKERTISGRREPEGPLAVATLCRFGGDRYIRTAVEVSGTTFIFRTMAQTRTSASNPAQQRQLRSRQRQRSGKPRNTRAQIDIPWTMTNFIGIGVGLVVILIGYMLMQSGIADDPIGDKSIWNNTASTTLAPIVLTIGYCVILPIAIFWRKKDENEAATETESENESN